MSVSKTYFSDEGGFVDDDLAIPLQVLRGTPVHRVFDGDIEMINDRTRVIHGEGIDLYQTICKQDASHDLLDITHDAYKILLKSIIASRKNLLRIWNFVPNILQEENNQERYRVFNTARFNVMRELGITAFPAATGIGSEKEPLIIEMLATTNPVVHLQNPLQMPSMEYSSKYGVHPPLFSRATFHHAQSPELFVSGTASVLGEDTVHPKNIEKQVNVTMNNIRTLISRDNMERHNIHHRGFLTEDLMDIRVFLKKPEDMDIVASELAKHIDDPNAVTYLKDDICRKNLLVEIEGVCRKQN